MPRYRFNRRRPYVPARERNGSKPFYPDRKRRYLEQVCSIIGSYSAWLSGGVVVAAVPV